MLRLEGEREPVDDGAEDLEELPHAIEVLRLVYEPAFQVRGIELHSDHLMFCGNSLQEEVVDLLPDERPQPQELAVDSVQHGLEEVTLARVLSLKGGYKMLVTKYKKAGNSLATK